MQITEGAFRRFGCDLCVKSASIGLPLLQPNTQFHTNRRIPLPGWGGFFVGYTLKTAATENTPHTHHQ
jgi:hypothetical protein